MPILVKIAGGISVVERVIAYRPRWWHQGYRTFPEPRKTWDFQDRFFESADAGSDFQDNFSGQGPLLLESVVLLQLMGLSGFLQ